MVTNVIAGTNFSEIAKSLKFAIFSACMLTIIPANECTCLYFVLCNFYGCTVYGTGENGSSEQK